MGMLHEKKLTKADLVRTMAVKQQDMSVKNIELAVRILVEQLGNSLQSGKRVEIRGFGSFSLRYRAARKARNPKTGEFLFTKDKYTVHFKPGKELREKVNETNMEVSSKCNTD